MLTTGVLMPFLQQYKGRIRSNPAAGLMTLEDQAINATFQTQSGLAKTHCLEKHLNPGRVHLADAIGKRRMMAADKNDPSWL
jgi:hypothetical protein